MLVCVLQVWPELLKVYAPNALPQLSWIRLANVLYAPMVVSNASHLFYVLNVRMDLILLQVGRGVAKITKNTILYKRYVNAKLDLRN